MKKPYLLLVAILSVAMSFGQSVIVTIDRANVTGPTTTGNDASISSVGLTRGSGVNQRPGTDFSSNNWTETSQANAETNNDYIEWSTSSSAAHDIEITRIDIKLRRNTNGPTNWQLYYSLDNFATAGIAVNTAQSLTANTNVVTNITGLSINSGSPGTITFRLYAWGAATNNGWLRVRRQASWSNFGVSLPGIRLRGNITTSTPNSLESNIIATSFDPTDDFNYTSYSAGSGLTTSNALKIGEFSIQDGGNDLTDSDALATSLSNITFDVLNSQHIKALAIFDGSTNISEATTVSENTSFTGITGLSAADNSSKTFSVYATFNSDVTDNDQIQLSIDGAGADISTGSGFETFDAGGAETPVSGNDNRIEVTASELKFEVEPSNSYQFETLTPYPSISAIDSNENIDLDFSNSISVSTTGTFDASATTSIAPTNGTSTFNNVIFSEEGTGLTLTASATGLASETSSTFDIGGPLLNIALQDFDGAFPEWSYTNDVAFFDNGWGTDGYYGLIDIDDASPIDHPLFSGNIIGDNDLNDEGNGTTSWATITFGTIDISGYDNVKIMFDWDIEGYVNNSNDAQYRLIYDGSNEPRVFLHDGNGDINSNEGSISIDVPNTVNTVALQIRIRNNRLGGFSGFDNFRVAHEFDGLLYKASTWTPNAPSGSTGSSEVYVHDDTYTVSSDIVVDKLYINSGATATVNAGESITVNSDLTNYGTLELNSTSTSYSSLIVDGSSEGEAVYKRFVNNTASPGENDANDLISAPVSGQTFADFATVNTNIVENPSNTSQKLFGPFNKTTGSYQIYDTDVNADANAILEAGNGYRAASSNSSTFTFEGKVETESVTKSIVVSGPVSQIWNLIGNPYPSYIKLSDFIDSNESAFDDTSFGVYGYDGDASDGYVIWNKAYSAANPNALIAPGQGFLVASKTGGATVTFNPNMRSTGSTDDFIAGRNAFPTLADLKLQLSTGSNTYKTSIYFNNEASLGMDTGYDAGVFGAIAPDFAIYSHLVEDNSGLDLAIQSVSFDALNNVVIPLGVNAYQGQQLTIEMTDAYIPGNVSVYLEDTQNNTFTLLNTSDYTFTPNADISGTGRFFLRVSEDALSTAENSLDLIQVFSANSEKAIIVNGQLQDNSYISIYDIRGRQVLLKALDHNITKNHIDTSHLETGIYVVRLSNETQQKTQKVILN